MGGIFHVNNVWQMPLRNVKLRGWIYKPEAWKGEQWDDNRIELYFYQQWGDNAWISLMRQSGHWIELTAALLSPVQSRAVGVIWYWQRRWTANCPRIQRRNLSDHMEKVIPNMSPESWERQSKVIKNTAKRESAPNTHKSQKVLMLN